MFIKLALNPQLNRETVTRIHRYLFDFGQGTHRVFWIGDCAHVETDCRSDVLLLKEQFPTIVGSEIDRNPHDFPW